MMNDLEKLYIEVELKVEPFESLGNTASMHVYEKGIDCYTDEFYDIVDEHFDNWDFGDGAVDDDLRTLLNDPQNTLLCPLSCAEEISFDGFMEYRQEKRFAHLMTARDHLKNALNSVKKHISQQDEGSQWKDKITDLIFEMEEHIDG